MPPEARGLQPEQRAPVGNSARKGVPQTRSEYRSTSRILLFTVFFLIGSLCAFAVETPEDRNIIENIEQSRFSGEQDGTETDGKKVAIGLGLEWNFNSHENFAGGASLLFNIDLPYSFAAGAGFSASYNFRNTVVLEPTALFRWYFLGLQKYTNLFAQADAGAYLFFDEGELTPMFTGGIRVGYRHLLGSFYIEPYGRAGYPYIFGIGVSAGLKF